MAEGETWVLFERSAGVEHIACEGAVACGELWERGGGCQALTVGWADCRGGVESASGRALTERLGEGSTAAVAQRRQMVTVDSWQGDVEQVVTSRLSIA